MITSLDVDAQQEFDELSKNHTFAELLKRGDVVSLAGAAKMLGYSPFGLRRACQAGRVGHIKRGDRYFFLRSQVEAARPRVVPPKQGFRGPGAQYRPIQGPEFPGKDGTRSPRCRKRSIS